MPPDPLPVVIARVETRLIAVERDVRDLKTDLRAENSARSSTRPTWPSVVSALVAASALAITLMQTL